MSEATQGSGALSLVERVYRELREAIITGTLPPGSPLRLQELARAHDVSLIPIREALRLLEVERLVDTVPNRGARVAVISVEDVVDAYATRQLLEVEALRQAWKHRDPEQIAHLRDLHTKMVAAYRANDFEHGRELHRRLHFTIYEASQSDWLSHLIGILWSHTERYRRMALSLRTSLEPYDETKDLHGLIIDALEDGHRHTAAKALRDDLRRTERVLVAHYRRNDG